MIFANLLIFYTLVRHIFKTRGRWATLITWETVTINKHICAKQWLCYNITINKIIIYPFWELNGRLFVKKTKKKNLCSLHTKIHCPKFGWNWSSGPWEDDFSLALPLNKFDFPLPKSALCKVWFKFTTVDLKRFLNFVNKFPQFRHYLPFEKRQDSSFE